MGRPSIIFPQRNILLRWAKFVLIFFGLLEQMEETVSDTVLVALITAAGTIISAGLAAVLQKTNKR